MVGRLDLETNITVAEIPLPPFVHTFPYISNDISMLLMYSKSEYACSNPHKGFEPVYKLLLLLVNDNVWFVRVLRSR